MHKRYMDAYAGDLHSAVESIVPAMSGRSQETIKCRTNQQPTLQNAVTSQLSKNLKVDIEIYIAHYSICNLHEPPARTYACVDPLISMHTLFIELPL